MRDRLLGSEGSVLWDGSMTSDLLLLAALGLVFAFLAGLMLGYALRSYISRRRRRRRNQRYDPSAALSPPAHDGSADADVVPLAPELDGGPDSGSRKRLKQHHRN